MNHLESLFELIRSKKELFGSDSVPVSLGEIADAWKRQNIYREDEYHGGGSFKWKVYTIEMNFLQDIASGIERLQEKKLAEFKYIIKHQRYPDKKKEYKPLKSTADIYSLDSLQDKIYFDLIDERKKDISENTIKNLVIVEPELTIDKDIKILFNDNYQKYVKAKRHKYINGQLNNWEVLFQAAKKNPVLETHYKPVLIYFNYNKRCKLYTQSGYEPTRILRILDGYVVAAIPMEVISEKTYQKRLNEQNLILKKS